MKTATFGGGCFWGVEAVFRQHQGVMAVTSGYEGGNQQNPSYQDVCSGLTGHAEVVEIKFDPIITSYRELLKVFFANHNPTQLNQQGPDIGSQYRSAVFFHDESQRQAALDFIAQLSGEERFNDRQIVTEVTPASTFYRAEEYHQDYLTKNGLGSCHI